MLTVKLDEYEVELLLASIYRLSTSLCGAFDNSLDGMMKSKEDRERFFEDSYETVAGALEMISAVTYLLSLALQDEGAEEGRQSGNGFTPLKEPWTGELIGKMHMFDVTYDDLAQELGWVKGYISMILNGQRNPLGAKEKMIAAFDSIVARKQSVKTDSGE